MTGELWPPSRPHIPASPAFPVPGTKLVEIRFCFNGAYLTAADRQYLITLGREVPPGTGITVEGHADSAGSFFMARACPSAELKRSPMCWRVYRSN